MEASVRSVRVLIRFGVFEVDLRTHELYKRGHRIKLQDQPFQILAILLERPGDLVTRDELRQRLWPGESVASMDDGLNAAIRRLRFALNDSAGRSKHIETLPRRGYRFLGTVERVVVDEFDTAAPENEPNVVAGRFPQAAENRPRIFAIIAAILAAAFVAAFLASPDHDGDSHPPHPTATKFVHVTKAAGVETNPTLSPDGKAIAYVAIEDGWHHIFLQAAGSERAINLTRDSSADHRQPAFSPDGRLIAFRSERDQGGIFIMNTSGDAVRRVADFGFDPAWSPDGKELVVATEGVINPLSRTSISALWKIDVASGAKTEIFEGDGVQPAWSPDGKRIVFWRTSGNAGKRDIATIGANGGPAVMLTDDAAIDWSPVWSPDGKWIYFSSDRGGSMNLWRIPADEQSGTATGEPEPMTTPSRWSGDLSVASRLGTIAFAAAERKSNIEMIAFDPTTGEAGEITPVTRATLSLIQPAVSPDGEWVVYRSEIDQEDIYLSRTDGTQERKLTNDLANDRAPVWSPDGSRIAFYSDRSGKYEAWSIRPDGMGLQQMTRTAPDAVFFPQFFDDGSAIVVNTSSGSFTVSLRDGVPATVLEPLPSYPHEGQVFRASALSRDQKWLAGTLYSTAGRRIPGVAVYSFDDRRYKVVTAFGSWPNWLSDSRRLVFSNENALYVADRVTGETRKLASVSGEIPFGVSVSRDDREIFFAQAAYESDIWLATIE